MYCDHKSVETIQGRKLFKGGNYSRAETIWGNTVLNLWCKFLKENKALPGLWARGFLGCGIGTAT